MLNKLDAELGIAQLGFFEDPTKPTKPTISKPKPKSANESSKDTSTHKEGKRRSISSLSSDQKGGRSSKARKIGN